MQDDIQDKVEHNPYHDVDAQDICDVHVTDHQEVEQDEHQREHADSHRAQVNHQEADDVAQRQRIRIAHKELPAPHGISKHVVEPERDDYTQRRNAEQGEGKQMEPDVQSRQILPLDTILF